MTHYNLLMAPAGLTWATLVKALILHLEGRRDAQPTPTLALARG